MIITMIKLLIEKNSKIFLSLFLFLMLVFGRNFTGIYVFEYRIGEIIVALQIILMHYFIFRVTEKKLKYIYAAFLVLFYMKLYYVIFDIEDLLLFRFSSILWATSMFAFGYEFRFNKKIYFNILSISLVLLYVLNYVHYPNMLIEFFMTHSDKFDYTKPSDLLLIFSLTNFFAYRILSLKSFFAIFSITSLFYFPIFVNQSRGTFVALVISLFLIITKFLITKFDFKFNLKMSLVSIFIVVLISGIYFKENIQETTFQNSYVQSNNFSSELEKIDEDLGFIFLDRGFLASSDTEINWRFTIWQTTLKDMYREKLLIYGNPIHKEIPILQHIYYKTSILENYNLHNFLIQFFAYFGFVGIVILIVLFTLILKLYYKSHVTFDIAFLIIPVLIVSSFDSSMESVRFPFIFYYSLGLLINSKDS